MGIAVRVLWLHARPHIPDSSPFEMLGMTWHNALPGAESLKDLVAESPFAIELSLDNESQQSLEKKLWDLAQGRLDLVLFTINPSASNPRSLNKARKLEDFLRDQIPAAKIVNPPSRMETIRSKLAFFQEVQRHLGSDYVPKFFEISSVVKLWRTVTAPPYPVILGLDSAWSGKSKSLIRPETVASNWEKTKTFLWTISRMLVWGFPVYFMQGKAPKIVAVEYIDHYFEVHQTFASFRVFHMFEKLYFGYPHVSTKNWNTHTNEQDIPDWATYSQLVEVLKKAIKENPESFARLYEVIGLHSIATDLVLRDGKPVFLESEIKYGPDGNFITGQFERYELRGSRFLSVRNGFPLFSLADTLGL